MRTGSKCVVSFLLCAGGQRAATPPFRVSNDTCRPVVRKKIYYWGCEARGAAADTTSFTHNFSNVSAGATNHGAGESDMEAVPQGRHHGAGESDMEAVPQGTAAITALANRAQFPKGLPPWEAGLMCPLPRTRVYGRSHRTLRRKNKSAQDPS